MRARLNSREYYSISRLQERLCNLRDRFEDDDVKLKYGNGTASEQISCAIASLECILQEYY